MAFGHATVIWLGHPVLTYIQHNYTVTLQDKIGKNPVNLILSAGIVPPLTSQAAGSVTEHEESHVVISVAIARGSSLYRTFIQTQITSPTS